MRIAYLILTHTDPQQLKRLVASLYVADSTFFFIHVDAKQDIIPFQAALQDCHDYQFIPKRIAINWGGYSLCMAEKELLKASIQFTPICDRFILLSGLDYPLWSNKKMLDGKYPKLAS